MFNKIDNINIYEVSSKQVIGKLDVLQDISGIKINNDSYEINPKIDIIDFYQIHASKRNVEKIVEKSGIYYTDMNYSIKLENPDQFTLYCVGTWSIANEFNSYHKEYIFTPSYYIDFNNNQIYSDYEPYIYINDEQIDLSEIIDYDINEKMGVPNVLKTGNGVILECSYQVRQIDYLIEKDRVWNTLEKKNDYLEAIKIFIEWQKECENNQVDETNYDELEHLANKEKELRQNINNAYKIYIKTLIEDQKAQAVSETE